MVGGDGVGRAVDEDVPAVALAIRCGVWIALTASLGACGAKSQPGVPVPGEGTVNTSSAGGGGPTAGPSGGSPTGSGGPPGGSGTIAADDWPQFRHDARGSSASAEALLCPCGHTPRAVDGRDWPVRLRPAGPRRRYGLRDHRRDREGPCDSDAATGVFRWTRDLKATTNSTCGGPDVPGIWGAVAAHDGKIYVGAPDGDVHALSPSTGETLWRAHVAEPSPTPICSSPTIATTAGRLFVGVAATAHCDPIEGRAAAVDIASAAVTEQPIVPTGLVGGAVWSSTSIDEAGGAAYVATGNAVGPLSDEPLAQAVVALDVATLTPRDHWQNPTTLANCDFGASPTLFEDASGGRCSPSPARTAGSMPSSERTSRRARCGSASSRSSIRRSPTSARSAGRLRIDGLAGLRRRPALCRRRPHARRSGRRVVAPTRPPAHLRFTHATPGFVLAAVAVAGDVLAVASNASDNLSSTLEMLDAHTGAAAADLLGSRAPPSRRRRSADGVVLWVTFDGHLTRAGR